MLLKIQSFFGERNMHISINTEKIESISIIETSTSLRDKYLEDYMVHGNYYISIDMESGRKFGLVYAWLADTEDKANQFMRLLYSNLIDGINENKNPYKFDLSPIQIVPLWEVQKR